VIGGFEDSPLSSLPWPGSGDLMEFALKQRVCRVKKRDSKPRSKLQSEFAKCERMKMNTVWGGQVREVVSRKRIDAKAWDFRGRSGGQNVYIAT